MNWDKPFLLRKLIQAHETCGSSLPSFLLDANRMETGWGEEIAKGEDPFELLLQVGTMWKWSPSNEFITSE